MAKHADIAQLEETKKGGGFGGLLIMAVAVVVLVFLMRTFVLEPYEIPSGSMEPTIQCNTKIFEGTPFETTTNDMVFSEKVSYRFRSAQCGDVITFTDPEMPSRELIKRVVATEGQTVTLENGKVCIDGKSIDEPYVNGLPSYALNSPTVKYPYVVPEGCVWVMGDNRTHSQDSRYFGAIPLDSVTGRALAIYWPTSHWAIL